MSAENKALFRRYAELWTSGDVSRLDEIIGPGYVGHVGADPGKDHGLDVLKQRIAEYHAASPGMVVAVEEQLSEGDRVFTRMTARRKDEATGKEMRLAGFNVSKFRDGKIVEEWALWERPG